MRKFWFGEKKHIDQDKVKEQQEAKKDLHFLLECGDEEGFIALIKELKPMITPEELKRLVLQFREERQNPSRGS
jgi:hypothetical protein